MTLRLTCLGEFQITRDGEPLTAIPTDKVRALLVYLAVEGRVHTRNELVQLFWPGYTAESANNNLRQSLHRLRHLLPEDEKTPWLLTTRQSVQINPDAPIIVDVTTFTGLLADYRSHAHTQLAECPACLARLQQAVDLYQGDFLAGFTLADTDGFEEWRRITQEHLHLQMLDALAQLAEAAESAGDDEGALQHARRQLALEPWLEAAHRRIMRILAQRGQTAAAIAQYNRCRQVLAEEMGVEPEAETVALVEQIQRGEVERKGRRTEDRRQEDRKTEDSEQQVSSVPLPSAPLSSVPLSSVPLSPPLPVFLSPFVGRAQALAEIGAQLQQPGVRLLTLIGPGGMGKTRLAVEVGRTHQATFADGVWFVPLAAISTADALPGAIATVLGITLQGSEPRQALLQSLHTQQLLLILDNYEHLLVNEAAVDLVVDLLARAPGVQILVTSRQRLNLRGEQLYPVQALRFPSTATLAEATSASAVHLFVQAVQRVQADFQLTATNLPAVLRICQLVQGMPLGLELAAANAGSAPLRAIADALEQSAEILAVEWRDLPARQRSMRAVFAWSWQLLSAAEQRVLRQCAIFRGGFDYTAAQAVVGATPVLLTQLVNKSLLQWQAAATGEGRYVMHELLRQFADEALTESGECAAVAERHGRYYLAYLAARGFRLGRGEPKEAGAEIQGEVDNVRLAWHWAATQGGLAELDQALYAWWQFCLLQGVGGEVRQSLAAALTGVRTYLTQRTDDAALRLLGERLLAKLLALHANHLFAQGRDEEMAAQAREAMQLGAASGGFEGEILGTYVLGRVLQDAGDQKREAQALWEQALQLIRHYLTQQPTNELLHELHWMTHEMLRGSALHFGDYAGCRAHIIEALHICQTLGKQRGELSSLSCLGEINFFLYDFAAAEADYRAELALGRSLGYRQSEMSAQEGLARVVRLRGDYTTARTLLEQSLSTATELALHYDEALLLAALSRLHCQLGDQRAAASGLARLTQLLAQVKLAKECQLYGYLAAAIKAHYAGDKDEALAAAEAANRINQQGGDILFRLVDTALILGHTRAAAGQWEAATAAFQEALAAFQQFAGAHGAQAVAAEPQAGLAQIALAQGDTVGALAQIEALLPALAAEPHAGYNDPFFIYLTSYRVLAANGDSRAATILQQGYDLLHQDAAALDDESRQRFLTAVPLHRELVVAYTEMQAQRDKVTSTSSVTESPNHPVTESPNQLVTLSPSHLVTPSPSHNLPATLTPFIGRTRSMAEIRSQLQQGVRLLTLIGPGGMGKTRLAVEAGRQQVAAYADGVWFVPLAALTNPAALAPAIAATLNLSISGGDLGAALAQLLQPKRLLLILDNFEQLLTESSEGAELVAALLQAAPGVQILVTSRERLQLRSEQLYQVPPLSVDRNATLDEATTASAARLFVQSAQLVQADFQLTNANLAVVLRLCDLVQGMPLGLELAAAQVGTLSLAAIADAIAQSAEFLTTAWVDMPARQRSMRAVFAWSWRLLTPAEQRALRQISIFRGGFDPAAAQAVTGAPLPLLTRLLHKSLLQRHEVQERSAGHPLGEGGRDAVRYLMHELLRQFAAEELSNAGEDAQIAAQHGQYYLAYLAARGRRLGRGEPKEASAEIQVELDNVRLAWQWAITHGRLAELEGALYAWWQFCQFQGLEAEGRQSFAAAIAGVRTQQAPVRLAEDGATALLGQRLLARLLAIHANFLYVQGRNEEMAAQAREAINLGRGSGDVAAETFGVFVLGRSAQEVGQLQEADALWRQTIDLVQRYQPAQPENEFLHDAHWMALNALRGNAISFGDYAGSRAYLMQALQVCQTLGKRQGELLSLSRLAQTNFLLYDFAAAEAGWRAALDLARTLGYRRVEMLAQEGLGGVSRLRGDYATARRLLEQAMTIATELAAPYEEAAIAATLIRLHTQLGDQAAAAQRHEQLSQLLARVKLIKECQLYYHLAAALKAHAAGAGHEALHYAEQANQLIESGDILFRVADTALILGHTRAAVGQWVAATAAFQQALAAFQQFAGAGNPLGGAQTLAAEPQAGLAQIALAQGDLAVAQSQVEAILPILAEQPHAGYNNPFFIYWTCYRVLAANADSRAATILQQGHDLLQQDAARLDEESRQRFLTAVPLHRDLVAAYTAMQAQEDKTTRRQEDKKREERTLGGQAAGLPVFPSALYDWAEMPMVDFFVERTAEVAQLTAWLTPTTDGRVPAQLISILGMGGMGKTTLAAAVTKAVAPNFQVVIWRSLLNAPPLSELLCNWLQVLSRQTLTTPPDSLDEQLRLLLTYLQQERCLLVLDNVESIFAVDLPSSQPQSRAGVSRPGYEDYDQLFQRLASSDHQSCLLLTSREQPYALLRSGRQAQSTGGRIRVLPLNGLDQAAGHALLASNGLHTTAAEAAQLVENYSGNPLALQIVAATIADFFGGDVAAFQQEEGQIFDGMRLILDQQFARLSPLEQEILVWLAIEREAITVPVLRSNFVQPVATAPLLEALQALQNRSLLEKRDSGFTLQNVIIEYATEYLVARVCREIEGELRNAFDENPVIRNAELVNSFLNRFALLKAQTKAYVRQSQQRLIVQPVAQQLLRKLGQPSLLARCQELLDLLRKLAPHTPGYAAGNLLNLLLALGLDLTSYDFSNLCVWQPYLREKTLSHFNFTNADLRSAAFTDTFDIVRALAYSPDGRFLAAGTSDGEIRLWRASDGQLLANVKGHGDIVGWLCFLDDGKTLISYSHDLPLAVWQVGPDVNDAAAGEAGAALPLRLLYHNNELSNLLNLVALQPQGELLALAKDSGWLSLWHLGARRRLSELTLSVGQIHTLRFSPDGKTLAIGASDRRIHLWDIDASTGSLALRQSLAETPAIARDLSFRADGRTLASGHADGAIYLWALDAVGRCVTGQPVHLLSGHRAEVWRVVFSPDGQLLASSSDDHSVRLWAMGPAALSGQPLARFDDHRGWVRALAFSPDGHALASAGADRTIRVWDLRSTQLLYTLYGYVKAVKSIAFSPDSRLLVSGSDDQRVRLWDVGGGRCLQTWTGHTSFIWRVAVSPDGRLVASASDDHHIYLRDASNGQGQDCRVRMWDVASGALIRTWDAATQVVWAVAFSPNGEYLAFGGEPNRVRLWHLPSQQFHPALENETVVLRALAFSPDSTRLAAVGHDTILYVWQVGEVAPPLLLPGHQHRIQSVAFSPDGQRLATASFDHTVRLWDLQNQSQIRTLLGHSNHVLAVAFSADGALVASASEDETIRFWDSQTGEPLSVLPMPGPYAGMNITGVTGISEAQKAALRALGAVEE
ncbi:MAG: NACHT domain-containing protein [Caldilinea sp. CFX5]|nr:NACHT domain-containing protein [Caldilinea sp. CFX5]